jgi:peptidoglycan/LPS O-acetylase OafA/YrhL
MPSPAPARSNFDALLLFACGLLIYGNGLILTGAPGAGLWGAPLPRVGLDLLFTVAGYKLVRRYERAGAIRPYLAQCALRLLPGLAASVLVTTFIIGPLATKLSLRFYFLNGMTARYLLNIILLPHFWLPRVFEGQQWSGAVNPLLWVLAPGALCIALVPALRPAISAVAALLCAAASICLLLFGAGLPQILLGVSVAGSLTAMPFFFGGAIMAWLERRAGAFRADLAMLLFAANWILATWAGEWDLVLEWLTLPYMACCFGRGALPVVGQIGDLGRPAYGMFLYAFPIQQVIVARAPEAEHPILLCFALALAAGLLSWHLVEAPALRYAGVAVTRLRSFGGRHEVAG